MESLLDLIKRLLARIFYTPRPFRNFDLPAGYHIEPFWADKGQMGFFAGEDSDGQAHIILYWYGENYAEVSQLLRKEYETIGATLLELRDVHTARTSMRLWVYSRFPESLHKFEACLQSDCHRLFLNASANTQGDIEAFVGFFSRL